MAAGGSNARHERRGVAATGRKSEQLPASYHPAHLSSSSLAPPSPPGAHATSRSRSQTATVQSLDAVTNLRSLGPQAMSQMASLGCRGSTRVLTRRPGSGRQARALPARSPARGGGGDLGQRGGERRGEEARVVIGNRNCTAIAWPRPPSAHGPSPHHSDAPCAHPRACRTPCASTAWP